MENIHADVACERVNVGGLPTKDWYLMHERSTLSTKCITLLVMWRANIPSCSCAPDCQAFEDE